MIFSPVCSSGCTLEVRFDEFIRLEK